MSEAAPDLSPASKGPSCGNPLCKNPLCNGTIPVPSLTARVNDPRLSRLYFTAEERVQALQAVGVDPVAWALEAIASPQNAAGLLLMQAEAIVAEDSLPAPTPITAPAEA